MTTAAARTLLAPLEDSGGRADLVARRLGAAIRLGLLLDGERLPSEAQLAAQLGVSTVTLRDALTTLREQGLVTTRRGRGGGSFVQAPTDFGALLRRFSVHELGDLGDQRCAIAGAAARLAAERALPEEVRALEDQLQRLRTSTTASERRRADTQITIGIAAAAQSPRLTLEEALLRAEVGDLLGEVDHETLVAERTRLIDAIARGDAGVAGALAERQVRAETEHLIRLRLEQSHAIPSSAGDALDDVCEELDRVFGDLDRLGRDFGALVTEAAGRLTTESLKPLRAPIFALLEEHGELVTGAGVVTAPGLLTDTRHWLEWWWREGGGAPEPLRINLDQTAPDFYDYTSTDWYATPQRTLQPRIAGPYVDHACTNQYAITLSVPVAAGDGLVGVAAADVLVRSLEWRIVPALIALGRPAALTSGDGRVIASNAASLMPGRRLTAGTARPASSRFPLSSWLLVEP